MFVFVAHCACNCATMQTTNSEAFPALEGQCDIYIHRIKFIMLEVRENEIAVRKLSGGSAHAQLRGNTAGLVLLACCGPTTECLHLKSFCCE